MSDFIMFILVLHFFAVIGCLVFGIIGIFACDVDDVDYEISKTLLKHCFLPPFAIIRAIHIKENEG